MNYTLSMMGSHGQGSSLLMLAFLHLQLFVSELEDEEDAYVDVGHRELDTQTTDDKYGVAH